MGCLRSYPFLLAAVLGLLGGPVGGCTPSSEESTPKQADTLTEKEASEQAGQRQSVLAQQRNRWRDAPVSDYRFTLIHSIAKSPSSGNPIIVTVRNDTVASAHYKSAPEIVDVKSKKKKLPTVDSLFAFIEHSAQQGVDSLRVRYDAKAGFPYSIFVDRDVNKTNDEVEIEVKDFVALPPTERP